MKLNITEIEIGTTKSERFNLPLDIICTLIFLVPIFIAMPEWYLVMEAVLATILVGFVFLGSLTIWTVLSFNKKPPTTQEFFTIKRCVVGWFTNIVILTSLYVQELDFLLGIYMVGVLMFNITSYIWLKK